jgi:hypothetical protein
MDERSLERTAGFARLSGDLTRLLAALMDAFLDGFLSHREAAE